MKRRSLLVLALCAALSFSLFAEAAAVPVFAATTKSSSSKSGSKSSSSKQSDSSEDEDQEELTEVESEATLGSEEEDTESSSSSSKSKKSSKTSDSEEDAEAVDSSSSTSKTTKSSSKTTKTTKTTTRSSGSSSSDSKGNKLLMTESQRRNKFRSKTNPKRGLKPDSIKRPDSNGFMYADFGMCNSYNSDNGLGGTPIYLLGTIMDIQKVYENDLYYGTVLLVNDCDGYQWYMRAEINKLKYDMFRKDYLGKSGYIYGRYSGYSGVTNRPMMDVTVIQPNGGFMTDVKLYK